MQLRMHDRDAKINRLRDSGWNVRWFSYVNRDGGVAWRATAEKPGSPAHIIEATTLEDALAGLFSSTGMSHGDSAPPSSIPTRMSGT
jgi:hypothetical protein